jgi:hypothetical protein
MLKRPASRAVSRHARRRPPAEGSGHEGRRGLRRNAIGLPRLVAQSPGVTAPEISAVVIAAVVPIKIGGLTPLGFVAPRFGETTTRPSVADRLSASLSGVGETPKPCASEPWCSRVPWAIVPSTLPCRSYA